MPRRLVLGLVIWISAVLVSVLAIRGGVALGLPFVHYALARDKIDDGDYEQGLHSLEKLLDARPRFALAHEARGDALCKLARHADALAAYEAAVSIAPDKVSYNHDVAWTLARLERYDAALAAYERVLALEPSDEDAREGKRYAKSRLGMR